ncbi:hypothetical protein D3C81_1194700 [compost metagenome]
MHLVLKIPVDAGSNDGRYQKIDNSRHAINHAINRPRRIHNGIGRSRCRYTIKNTERRQHNEQRKRKEECHIDVDGRTLKPTRKLKMEDGFKHGVDHFLALQNRHPPIGLERSQMIHQDAHRCTPEY